MAAMAEFRAYKRDFILKLYASTKDAVEVARRHYLESRLANGIQREMRELQERCETLCKREGEELFCDTMVEFELLKDRVERATVRLKARSDEFYRISAHGLPYKVERMTFDELKRAQLPNYSQFLLDPENVSFGPISEKWETFKLGFIQQVMDYFTNKPQKSLNRSMSISSEFNNPAIMLVPFMEETDEDDDDDDTLSLSAFSGNETDTEQCQQLEPDQLEVIAETGTELRKRPGSIIAENVAPIPAIRKPSPLPRRRRKSFKKTFSAAWNHVVLQSAAQSMENKRLTRVFQNISHIPSE